MEKKAIKRPFKDHLPRVLTGFSLILILTILFIIPTRLPLEIFFAMIIAAAIYEGLTLDSNYKTKLGLIRPILLGIIFFFTTIYLGEKGYLLSSFFTLFIFAITLFIKFRPSSPEIFWKLCREFMFVIFIGGNVSFLLLLDNLSGGRRWLILLFFVVVACDTFAYYIGMKFGKHPIFPKVSPKKTIEGSLGGLLGSVLLGFITGSILLPSVSFTRLIIISLLLGSVSQLGDFFESAIKRLYEKKDSGNLLPGHGGVWDRIDGLLWAGPFLYLIARLSIGLE